MNPFSTSLHRIIALLLVAFVSGLSAEPGNQPSTMNEPGIAIQGYSLASYFTRSTAKKGTPAFALEYDDKTYHLKSAEQAKEFRANPQQFVPSFAEFFPYSFTLGRQVSIDPTNLKIIDGGLLLFHKDEEMNGLKQWNDHRNDQKLLEKAKQQYFLVTF